MCKHNFYKIGCRWIPLSKDNLELKERDKVGCIVRPPIDENTKSNNRYTKELNQTPALGANKKKSKDKRSNKEHGRWI